MSVNGSGSPTCANVSSRGCRRARWRSVKAAEHDGVDVAPGREPEREQPEHEEGDGARGAAHRGHQRASTRHPYRLGRPLKRA